MSRALTTLAAVTLASFGLGCDGGDSEQTVEHAEAAQLDGHECAACGMIVREQPAPRGQLVHRDGTRAWFCSVADMITYLEAPSPHGPARAVFVETSPPDASDPLARDTSRRPWIRAEEAWLVTGMERERIMGTPYLIYASRQDAERIAESLGARVVRWEEVASARASSPAHALASRTSH